MKKILVIAAALLLGLSATSCKKDGPVSNAKSLIGTWNAVSTEYYKGTDKITVDSKRIGELGAPSTLIFKEDGKGIEKATVDGRTMEVEFSYTVSNGKLTITTTTSIGPISMSGSTTSSVSLSGDNLIITEDSSDAHFKDIMDLLGNSIDKRVSTYKRAK